MTRLSAITTALALAGVATFSHGALAQTGTGWTQLFDGKSLDGWTQVGTANWRVEDGALVADKSTAPARPDGQPGGGGHLVTKNSYKNHMIYAEFWTDEKANSGIFVRCKDPKKIGARDCYEFNIFDSRPDPSYGNGTKTADVNNGMFEEGHFTLQWGSGVIKFRKVAVKTLP